MLYKKSIVGIEDIENEDLFNIFHEAKELKRRLLKGEVLKDLEGKIMCTLFFEPSTRTRLSFESAMERLGGKIISVSEGKSSSAAKGETIGDTIRMAASYSDVVVMRHPLEGAARLASEFSKVPVINGGDGSGQHPTQTILDLFTIWEKFSKIECLKVGLVGDLKYGRTVHSLIRALDRFDNKIYLISPEILSLPEYVMSSLKRPENVKVVHNLDDVISELDIFYVTRIQKERFIDPNDYSKVIGSYSFDSKTVKNMKDEAIIMHPLPRVDEIKPDVDEDQRAYYFKQAENGVYVRMAILKKILKGD